MSDTHNGKNKKMKACFFIDAGGIPVVFIHSFVGSKAHWAAQLARYRHQKCVLRAYLPIEAEVINSMPLRSLLYRSDEWDETLYLLHRKTRIIIVTCFFRGSRHDQDRRQTA